MASFIKTDAFYQNTGTAPQTGESGAGHFNIIRLEDLLIPKEKPVSYSRRSYYKVSFAEGNSKIHYADRCIEIDQTALVFTHPMVPYHWERVSEKQTGFICIFNEEFLRRFGNIGEYPVFKSVTNAVINLDPEQAGFFKDFFIKMDQELAGAYSFKYELLSFQLMELIHQAQKIQPDSGVPVLGSNAFERIAVLFTDLLERQFPIEQNNQVIGLSSPSAFADRLNIHVNHLNKALKEITASTTSNLISLRIMEEAKVLLKNTTWPVGEIARCLGFAEPQHFSLFFKKHHSSTPADFRRSKID